MSPVQKRPTSILAVSSVAFGAAAFVCAVLFYLSPKHGIAVEAGVSAMRAVAMSVIGITLGLVVLIRRARRSWLAPVGVLACAVPLVYILVSIW